MEYEFTFVVDGISEHDEASLFVLYENYDAILMSQCSVSTLVITGDGGNAVEAANKLIGDLKADLPGMKVLRLDPDLVGVSDIANRVGRTRQNIAQFVSGERGCGIAFPSPEGVVGRSQVWRWAEVNGWLESVDLGDGVARPSREECLIIDLMAHNWLQAMSSGRPVLEVVAAQDERTADRMAVMNMLQQAVDDEEFIKSLNSLPRKDNHRIKIVCAVLLDPLRRVAEALGADEVSGALAAMSGDGELHLAMFASAPFEGFVSVEELGLGDDATVGDLILLQRNGRAPRNVPLTF